MINLGGLHTKRRLQSKWWRKCPSIEALIGFLGGIFSWSIVNYEKHDNHDNPIIYQLFMIIMIIHKRDRRWNTFENEDFSILSFGVSSRRTGREKVGETSSKAVVFVASVLLWSWMPPHLGLNHLFRAVSSIIYPYYVYTNVYVYIHTNVYT